MELFKKILKKDDVTKSEEWIPARCGVTKEPYDILIRSEDGKTIMICGKQSSTDQSRTSANRETNKCLKRIDLINGIYSGRLYHCPICGNKDIVRCGKCRRITCYDGTGQFTCAYCGNSGKVSGTMDSIDAYDNSGMKHNDMKYYPGDKGDKMG